MPAYCIADITVHSPEIYARYRQQVQATLAPYGGEFLVRAGALQVKEGDWQPGRMVVIRFPSMQQADAWYASAAYQAALPDRLNAAHSRLLFAEGVA